MTRIFLCATDPISPQAAEVLIACLPPEQRTRAHRDLSHGVGYLLVNYAVRILDPQADGTHRIKTPSGKPQLANGRVHFSLSHSGDLVAVAVSKAHPVGVDIEKITPRRAGFAARWFSETEVAEINAAEDRDAALSVYWTKKEAVAKCQGTGLGFKVREIDCTDTQSTLLSHANARFALSLSPAADFAVEWVDFTQLTP